MVVGLSHQEAGAPGQVGADSLRELGVSIDAGADGGATEGQLGQLLGGKTDSIDRSLNLTGVAAELLAKADGGRVLKVRPSGLDHRHELLRLLVERVLQVGERRDELFVARGQRRERE